MPRAKLWLLLILAVTFGVYAPSFANDFTYDDHDVVRVPGGEDGGPNKFVAELQPIGEYFKTSYSQSHDGLGRGLRPITVLSFAVVHALTKFATPPPGGPHAPAWAQHVLNVALHCVAVWLTFQFLALFLGAGLGALVGAAVFGLHAIRSDPVISIVGRAEIMGYAFGLTSLLLYVAALRRTGGERYSRLAGCAVSMFLAMGSKESAAPWLVMIPLTVLALRWKSAAGEPQPWPGLKEQFLPWLVALALPFGIFLGLLFNLWSQLDVEFRPAYESNPLWFASSAERIANGVIILGYGLYKVFLPWHLAHDYSDAVFTLADGFGDVRFVAVGAVLLGALVGGLVVARKHPLLFLAVAAFFGFTFLTSNIAFAVETIFGERLLYTPALALSLLVAWFVHRVRAPVGLRTALGVVALWAVVGSGLIVKRDLEWRDNATLFAADAENQPRSIRVQMTRMKYLREGDPRIWKQTIDHAHALNPKAPAPFRELAVFHLTMRQFAEAETLAMRGLASDHPDLIDHAAELDLLLAQALEEQGKFADAETTIRAAIALAEANPNPQFRDPSKRMELGMFFRRRGAAQKAKTEFRAIQNVQAGFPPVWDQLLFLAQEAKNDPEVEALIAQGTARMPGAPQFGLHRAILMHRRGDRRGAAQLYDDAIRYLPPVPATFEYYEFYARLLMEQNRIDEARQLVARFLRVPRLWNYQVERLVGLAKSLGMQPGK